MDDRGNDSFLNLVLFHLDFEVLGYVGFLGISALRVQHEAHGTVAALFGGLGTVPVCGDGGEGVQFDGVFGSFVAVCGLAFAWLRGPVRVTGKFLGLGFGVQRNTDSEKPVGGEMRPDGRLGAVVGVEF